MKLEIMFEDLNEETKKAVLEFYEIKDAKEMNLDVIPLIILEK